MVRGDDEREVVAVSQVELQPATVGWLDWKAELAHATAFLQGLRYRTLKAQMPRVTWWDRLLAFAGFVDDKLHLIVAQEQDAGRHLEEMFRCADRARVCEGLAQQMRERGGW